jgi:hypothetical protein
MIRNSTMTGAAAVALLIGGCGLEAHDAVRHAVSGAATSPDTIEPLEIAPRPGTPPTIDEAPGPAAEPATDPIVDMSLG